MSYSVSALISIRQVSTKQICLLITCFTFNGCIEVWVMWKIENVLFYGKLSVSKDGAEKFKWAAVWFVLSQKNHCAFNTVNMRTSVMRGQREIMRIFSLGWCFQKVRQKRDHWRLWNDLVAMTLLWRASEYTRVRWCTKMRGFTLCSLTRFYYSSFEWVTITVCLKCYFYYWKQ